MFRTLILTGLSVVALSTSAAFAADPPTKAPDATPAPAAKPEAKDADPIICRKEEETGTRLGAHKTCKPKSAWDEESRAARDMVSTRGRQAASPNS